MLKCLHPTTAFNYDAVRSDANSLDFGLVVLRADHILFGESVRFPFIVDLERTFNLYGVPRVVLYVLLGLLKIFLASSSSAEYFLVGTRKV